MVGFLKTAALALAASVGIDRRAAAQMIEDDSKHPNEAVLVVPEKPKKRKKPKKASLRTTNRVRVSALQKSLPETLTRQLRRQEERLLKKGRSLTTG